MGETSEDDQARSRLPQLPARLVDRPALTRVLDDAVARHRLVVVEAGAGWGKTTAVASWAMRRRACWFGVGDGEVSVARLSRDLLRALRHRVPRLPAELFTTAYGEGDDTTARVEALVALICGLLDAHLDEPLTLVVDDVGLLARGGDGARLLAGLCERSPALLHLVLLTNDALPFALTGAPHRIDPADLAFSRAEIAALAGPDAAESIWPRTAGWPAAVLLHLAAGDPEPPPAHGGPVLAELAARVLAREPEPTRALLRAIATLGRSSAALVAALGHPDAALPELARRGLLACENRDEPSWTVPEAIRDLLTAGQDPAAAAELHRRAAVFREREGDYAEALLHLMAAGRWDEVARLLLTRDEQIIAAGHAGAVLAALEKLPAEDSADPRMFLVWGYAKQHQGDWLAALHFYRRAVGTGPVRAGLAWRMGHLYDLTGQAEQGLELFRRTTFDRVPSLGEVRMLFLAARWFRERGDHVEARRLAVRCANAAQRCGTHAAQAWGNRALALLAAYDGDRVTAEMHYDRALDYARRGGVGLLEVNIRAERAWFLAEEADPAEALAEIDDVLALGRAAGRTGYEPFCLSVRARAAAKLGRLDDALADATQSQALCSGMGASREVVYNLVVLGDVHRRRGEPGQAQAFLDEALYLTGCAESHPLRVPALATLARIRAADDLASAMELADQAVDGAERLRVWRSQALLARGWVNLLAGDRESARADAAVARALTGSRRDRPGLADALQLAAVAASCPKTEIALLEEAGALWRVVGDPVGVAAARLAVARARGDDGAEADAVLRRHGVRPDAGMADLLGIGLPRAPRLAVRTLGTFQVLRDGVPVPTAEWQSKKARDLLKILIAHRGRPAPRHRLVELLWPDDLSDRTHNRLSVLLSTLRAVLGGEADAVVADRDTVSLDLSMVEVDVERFLRAVAAARAADRRDDPAAHALYTAAEELHHGEFLTENLYEDWAVQVREEVREAHAVVLRALVRLVRDPDQRIGYLGGLLEQDCYDEGAHLRLVRTLYEAGRYGEARRRYELYLERMAEIGVQTSPEGLPPTLLRIPDMAR
ncbi:BTAD domain-containing putative transcriptional regulator [Actinokineospora sp. 24-640]